ncbi:MAG: hypothetical protein CMM19_02355, partial [Rhodospirillaceae bacterium]|nr:hypothetical protein [Rhodospirillaceae bacterium]
VSDDTYVITVGSQAIAGQSGGGNAGNYGHTLGPNPFSTNSGSAIVSVADNSHGLAVGDVVQFENSATVGGLDLNVTFRVSGVTDANNYTVTATSNATSSVAAGGGSSVGLTIPELASVFDEKNSSILAQNKDMATFVSKIASAATSVANATLTNAVTDGNAAISNLNDANSELLEAKGVLDANTNAFIRHTNSTTFAATLNTTEITKGRASVLDAIGRLQTIEATLKLIDGYSKETFSSANATKYATDRAAIVSQLDNAGKVTGSTSGVLANNPFQTQSGNAQVTVTHAGHGLTAGDSVTFSGGATVGGLDLNSTFTVASVNDANTYTIAASSNASGNATGGGASVAFAGAPSVTLDNLLSVSGNKTYRIREGVNQFIAANPGLNDVDASGPYAINDSTRLSSLLPSTLTSGNGTSVASGSATFLKNVETVRKQLQRDLPVFDFVANTADPLGVLDSQVKGIKENIDQLFSLGDNRGLNLIDTGAGDLSITLGSIGKKITVGAQNQIKTNLTEAINNYTYSAIQGGESGSLSANPFTVKGGSIAVNPWRWDRTDSITKDESGNAILKFRSVQHGLEAGDSVTISGTATSFGRDLNGTYTVHSVRSTHTIYINVGVDLGDPPVFQINAGGSSGTIATNRVSVAHTAHPFSNGDTATFSGGASVGGASLNDSFTVFNATANSYEILSKTNATAQANGGGASVEFKTIPTERSKFLFDAYFDVSRALGKMRAERIKLGVEETLLKTEFNKPLAVESQFLKPLQNTDYAKKFIEKYLLIKDLQSTGVSFTPTNNNALAINLIRNINPNRGIGLSVNLLR